MGAAAYLTEERVTEAHSLRDTNSTLLEALKMVLAELAEDARPTGRLDPMFASPSMEAAFGHAKAAVKMAEGL
jgi:hypothetical protein